MRMNCLGNEGSVGTVPEIGRALICVDLRTCIYLVMTSASAGPLLSVLLLPSNLHHPRGRPSSLTTMQPLPGIKHLFPDELFNAQQPPPQHEKPQYPPPPLTHRRVHSDLVWSPIYHPFQTGSSSGHSTSSSGQARQEYSKVHAVARPSTAYYAYPHAAPQSPPQRQPSPVSPNSNSQFDYRVHTDLNTTHTPSSRDVNSQVADPQVSGSRGWPSESAPRVAREDRDRYMRNYGLTSNDDQDKVDDYEDDVLDVNAEPKRRHTCPVCDKTFNRPSSLRIHKLTHTGDKRKSLCLSTRLHTFLPSPLFSPAVISRAPTKSIVSSAPPLISRLECVY